MIKYNVQNFKEVDVFISVLKKTINYQKLEKIVTSKMYEVE